jgi:uncharacterized protein YndB with AHSA1/START domain
MQRRAVPRCCNWHDRCVVQARQAINPPEGIMLKTLSIIGAVLGVVVVAVLIYAATKPDTFRIQRTTSIKAPPETIYALIEDFHRWEAWSPWEKIDPALKRSYSGSPSGKGAVYAWDGNKDVGQGRMEIVESSPPSKLTLKLDFMKPFEAHNRVVFTLLPQGDATTVTQAMDGPSPYLSKLMGLVFNIDRMVGDKYEEGLASLKALAEK